MIINNPFKMFIYIWRGLNVNTLATKSVFLNFSFKLFQKIALLNSKYDCPPLFLLGLVHGRKGIRREEKYTL